MVPTVSVKLPDPRARLKGHSVAARNLWKLFIISTRHKIYLKPMSGYVTTWNSIIRKNTGQKAIQGWKTGKRTCQKKDSEQCVIGSILARWFVSLKPAKLETMPVSMLTE